MFQDELPAFVNSKSKKVASGLGTIPKVVANGYEIYKEKLIWKDAEEIIENFYFPFHMYLKQLLLKNKLKFGFSVLIDCHSMPSVSQSSSSSKYTNFPDFILGDMNGKSCHSKITHLIESFLSDLGYHVTRNKPYSGGFITQNYGRPENNSHAIQIEVNRGLYMNERTLEINDGYSLLKKNIKSLTDILNNTQFQFLHENKKLHLAAE